MNTGVKYIMGGSVAALALTFGSMKTTGVESALNVPSVSCAIQPVVAGRAVEAQPLVQIAILLDTSGSMEGLIEQAKGQLWKIVNEFIKAKQNGQTPEVNVALYEYGNDGLPASGGHIRMIQPLTHDLDKISQELFALKTNGGSEYCGWVIREAVKQLTWSSSPDVYRVIFIAGNEPFTQGPVSYAEACKEAISKGIVVNTIHCGGEADGINQKWKDGATLADGKYMVIDQNRAVVHFEAPQDAEIAKLGVELNKTYIPFGSEGMTAAANQAAQDANATALALSGALVNRAVTKASKNYRNDNWDLVDAVKTKKAKLEEIKPKELPQELQKMTVKQRAEYVEAKSKERTDLQEKIAKLSNERAKYVAEKVKSQAGTNTLDAAMTTVVRAQAAAKKFVFE